MKKSILLILAMMCCGTVFSGTVSSPTERVALPAVSGNHLVCIWDETADQWYQEFVSYDNAGSFTFDVPAWGRWYWIGLWDEASEQYVFGKWIGHFITN